MMLVRKLENPRDRQQCQLPKTELDPASIGWKGYRERRAAGNRFTPEQCMRCATYVVDGKRYCTQHAGIIVLEALSK